MLLPPDVTLPTLKSFPRLSLGLSLLLVLVFLTWHLADNHRRAELDQTYVKNLMPQEWGFYDTYLQEYGQAGLAHQLEAAYARKDYLSMAPQMGADRDFADSIRTAQANATDSYSQWMDSDAFITWNGNRNDYDRSHNRLSDFALGIVPQRVAVISLLSYQLVPQDLLTLVICVLFLATAGLGLELTMGSGPVLAAFIGGGVIGGIVFLICNGHGVFPLATPAVGTAAVVSMYLMQFRQQKMVLLRGEPRVPAWTLGVAWLLLTAFAAWQLHLSVATLVAILAGAATGPVALLGYQRWFKLKEAEVTVEPEESDKDTIYREQLDMAFQAISRMDFAVARKQLRSFMETYPQDLRAAELLYNMEKAGGDTEAYETTAKRIFGMSNTDAAAEVCLRVYRDYLRTSKSRSALDAETQLKLIMRFIRIKEYAESDNMMRKLVEGNVKHSLMHKAAASLAQVYDRLHDPRKATYYRDVAAG